MAKAKSSGRPVWFKIYTDTASSIQEVSSKTLGDVVKALFCLLEDENYEPELKSTPARMLFHQMRRGVEESKRDYERMVINGRRASKARWEKAASEDAGCIQLPYHSIEALPYIEPEQKQEQYPDLKKEGEEEQEPPMLLEGTGEINPAFLEYITNLPMSPEIAEAHRRLDEIMKDSNYEEDPPLYYGNL